MSLFRASWKLPMLCAAAWALFITSPIWAADQLAPEYESAPTMFTKGPTEVWSVAVSPTGHYIASADANGMVTLFDAESRQPRYLSQCHEDAIPSLSFSQDGKFLLTGSYPQGRPVINLAYCNCVYSNALI